MRVSLKRRNVLRPAPAGAANGDTKFRTPGGHFVGRRPTPLPGLRVAADATLWITTKPTFRIATEPAFRVAADATLRIAADATLRIAADAAFRIATDAAFRIATDPTLRIATEPPFGVAAEPAFRIASDALGCGVARVSHCGLGVVEPKRRERLSAQVRGRACILENDSCVNTHKRL